MGGEVGNVPRQEAIKSHVIASPGLGEVILTPVGSNIIDMGTAFPP